MMRMYTKRAVVRRINVAGLAITLYTLIMISWMYAIPKDGASMRWKVALVAVFVLAFACGFVLRYAGSFKSLKRICFLSEKNIVDFYMTDDLYALDADLRKVSHMFINPEKHRIERSIMFPSRGEIVRCVITLEVLPDVASLQKYVDAHYGGTESVNRTAVRDILTRALKDVALDPAIWVSIKRRIRLDLANYGLVATRCDCVSSNHRWFLG